MWTCTHTSNKEKQISTKRTNYTVVLKRKGGTLRFCTFFFFFASKPPPHTHNKFRIISSDMALLYLWRRVKSQWWYLSSQCYAYKLFLQSRAQTHVQLQCRFSIFNKLINIVNSKFVFILSSKIFRWKTKLMKIIYICMHMHAAFEKNLS